MKYKNAMFIIVIVFLVAAATLKFSRVTQGLNNSLTNVQTPTVSKALSQMNQVEIAPSLPTQPTKGITYQAIQKYARSSIQTVSTQGVEISATNFQRDGNELYIDVCYQLPNNSDWTIDQATLITKDLQVLVLSGGSGLEFTQTLEGSQRKVTQFIDNKVVVKDYSASRDVPDYRCDKLDFMIINPEKADLSSVKLTIDSLIAIPREGKECQVYNDKIQTALDAENSGIKFQCIQTDGGPQIQIVSKLASMSLSDAQKEISRYTITDIFQGPWSFESSIQ